MKGLPVVDLSSESPALGIEDLVVVTDGFITFKHKVDQ